jgi:hypothetical protein
VSAVPPVVFKLGLWWPEADPDLLKQAADVWQTFGHTVEQAKVTTEKAGNALDGGNSGQAINTCHESLSTFTGDLATTVAVAVDQASTLRAYAHHVEQARLTLIEMAAAAATVAAVCTVGAFFTLGAAEAGTGMATAGVLIAAEAVGVTLTNTAAAIIAGAVEASAIDFVFQEARIHIFGEGGFHWAELGLTTALGPASGLLGARLAAGAAPVRPSVIGAVDAAAPSISRGERIAELWRRLDTAAPPKDADEALGLVSRTLDKVEDDLSGVPKNPNPSLTPDGRMYPPQEDMIVRHADGAITAKTRGHAIEISPGGSMKFYLRHNGELAYSRGGADAATSGTEHPGG